MRILVLGGTKFVGRHLIAEALAQGHSITYFHRGKSGQGKFPGATEVLGDRDGGLEHLPSEEWDAVVDTCGYVPRLVKDSCHLLKNRAGRYLFISTISVYKSFEKSGLVEEDAVGEVSGLATEEVNAETYGPLKVACEHVVQETFGIKSTIVRPGLIIGPHDHTDRFTYWPQKIATQNRIAAPEPRETPMQFIDARDLAQFSLKLLVDNQTGVYNATGPLTPITLCEVLETCQRCCKSPAEIHWISPERIQQFGIQNWTDFPLWMPPESDSQGIAQVNCSKAIQHGLTFRPLDETVRDILEWFSQERRGTELKAGMSLEAESRLLAGLLPI